MDALEVKPVNRRLPTERQRMCLTCIRDSIRDRGYPPTLREIGAHMGIRSTNGINDHLHALERKGYVTRDDGKSRGLRLTVAGAALLGPSETMEPQEVEVLRLAKDVNRLAGLDRSGVASLELVAAREAPLRAVERQVTT